MTSQARIEANRLNAMKSTGPRTPAGKAMIGHNAMKHGLLSRESLVKGESEAELVNFGKRLRTQLAPLGELELLLVDRIVSIAWRLRRAGVLEANLLNDKHGDGSVLDQVFPWDSDRQKLQLLSRYEATLERGFYKALHELQRLQAARDGQPVPVPAVVDVNVSGADEMALIGESRTISGETVPEGDSN